MLSLKFLSTIFIYYFVLSCHRQKSQQEWEELRKVESELSRAGRSIRRITDIVRKRVNHHKLKIGSCAACGRTVRARSTLETLFQHCCDFDFDHQIPVLKVKAISRMVSQKFPLSKIWEEMKKCLLLCARCHTLKSKHRHRLTPRERQVFAVLAEGHAQNINPYDEKNFFTDDRAFLQFKLCIAFDMRGEKGNPDWCRPDDSFFVPILRHLNNTSSSSFSQISPRKRPPGFQFDWSPTPGTPTSQWFPLSRYDGDRILALGAALVFRREKRAEGISFQECQEDTAREQELIAKFLAWQGSSPAPPAPALPSSSFSSEEYERAEERQDSSPIPPAPPPSSSTFSLGEELHARALLARSEALLAQFQALDKRSRHPKRHCRHSLLTPPSFSSSSSFKEDKRVEEMLVRSRARDRRRKREASAEEEKSHPPKRHRRGPSA